MKEIKAIFSDVDGVLTDGRLFIDGDGEEVLKVFDVKDGMGIKLAQKYGIVFGVISGRGCKALEARMEDLQVEEVHLKIKDKLNLLKGILEKYKIQPEECLYIGDDLNDIEIGSFLMEQGGWFAAPSDAVLRVRESANYLCESAGGRGAVREVVDRVIEEKKITSTYLDRN